MDEHSHDFLDLDADDELVDGEGADGIQDEPTAVRVRASSPSDVLRDLPAITAPPSTSLLAQVSVQVTPLPPSANLLHLPADFSPFGRAPLLPEQPLERARRRRPFAPLRIALLVTAGLGFAALGVLVDRSGIVPQLSAAFATGAPPHAEAEIGALTLHTGATTSPMPIAEPLSGRAEPEAEATLDSIRALLGGDPTKPALLDAQTALVRMARAEPANPHVHACLAQLYLRLRMPVAALNEANEAVRLRPRRARYRVLLGDAFHTLGRAEEAEAAYARAAELDPQGRAGDEGAMRATNAL